MRTAHINEANPRHGALINRILPGLEHRCVALDDRYGAWLATTSDQSRSHAYWVYLFQPAPSLMPKIRLRGYYDALAESHIPANDRLVTFGEPDESGGEQAMTEFTLGRGRGTPRWPAITTRWRPARWGIK